MDSEVFAQLPPTKLFFRCAVPAVLTSVFGALYSVVDGLFVGRFLGEDALATINLIMPVIMIVEALSNMIATGASVNIAMLLGERRREDASRVFSFSVKFILLFSCALGVLGYFFARPFVMLLAPGASENAIAYSVEYLRVCALFAPLVPIYFATDNYLRVCGKQKMSMWINVATQALNVVLDFILIALLHRGVRAAAVASCISIALGSAVTLWLFAGGRMDLYYTREGIPAARFFRIVANGSSEFFSSIATSIMSVVLNLFLLKYGGTTAVAAFSIVMYVDSIIGMLNFGICDSLQPAISYCYGAGMTKRMKAIFRRVLIATVITAVAAFLFMLLAGPSVASVFIKPGDTELAAVSKAAIRLFSFSYLAGWVDMCFSSYFTALDRPVRSLLVSFFGTLVFPIAFLFILTAVWGLNGVWLMAAAASIASGVLTIILAATLKLPMATVDECMGYAKSREEFIALMRSEGFDVKWTDTRKYITYTTPDGNRCRDNKLHEEKYLKENMEYEFKIRQGILDGRAEGNESPRPDGGERVRNARHADREELVGGGEPAHQIVFDAGYDPRDARDAADEAGRGSTARADRALDADAAPAVGSDGGAVRAEHEFMYTRMLEVTFRYIGAIPLSKLRPIALENMLIELRQRMHHGKPVQEATVQKYLTAVSAVLSDAKRNEIIQKNPARMIDLPDTEPWEQFIPDPAEVERFIRALTKEPWHYLIFYLLAICTGCRRGELCALKWSDFLMESVADLTMVVGRSRSSVSSVGVVEGPTKNGRSRTIALGEDMSLLVSAYCCLKHREAEHNHYPFSEYLFTDERGRLIHPETFTKHLRKFYDRHGFPKEYHLHTLRHLYVTTLLHGGVDKQTVADLAGHGDTSFLDRTYCHPQMERKLKAARVISGLIPETAEPQTA